MKSNIYIAEKIKVGFNLRKDTYTGALGFIIPWDKTKGIWRKEKSWENWREEYEEPEVTEARKREAYEKARKHAEDLFNKDSSFMQEHPEKPLKNLGWSWDAQRNADAWERVNSSVKKGIGHYYANNHCVSYETCTYYDRGVSNDPAVIVQEHENVLVEGFVLNKKAGGYSSGWNHRQSVCRVYDPRGFEFEITIENLLYILEHTNSIVGKGLEGKFIYGWDRERLVLLPESCPEYSEMIAFTKLQETRISAKELVVGRKYLTTSNEEWLFLGKIPLFVGMYSVGKKAKHFVFVKSTEESDPFHFMKTCNTISTAVSDDIYQEELETNLELLEHHSNFALIDPSKDAFVEVSPEEMKELLEDYTDVYYLRGNKYEEVSRYSFLYENEKFPVRDKYYIKKQFLTNGKEHKKGSSYLKLTE